MSPELIPEDNSCRTKTMAGYAVGITSYKARGCRRQTPGGGARPDWKENLAALVCESQNELQVDEAG